MSKSGLASGIVIFLIGIGLSISVLFVDEIVPKIMFGIWGIIAILIGIYMAFNHKREDKIEQIRRNK